MPTRLDLVPVLLFACLLPACGSEPGTTTNDDPGGTTSTTGTTGAATDTPTSDPSTDVTAATGATSTGEPTNPGTTGDTTGPASTDTGEPTSTSSTTEDTTGAVSASDTSTSDTSDTGDTSTGDTGDTSTGEPGGLGPAAQDALDALEMAVDGVLFLSESDYPWTTFAIADVAPVTLDNVKDVIAEVYVFHGDPSLADRASELRTFNSLMDPLTVMQGWWGPEEIERAAQYQPIRDVFEDQLFDLQVFRFGKKSGNVLAGQVDVFVIGETADGDVVGMFTISVET